MRELSPNRQVNSKSNLKFTLHGSFPLSNQKNQYNFKKLKFVTPTNQFDLRIRNITQPEFLSFF